MSSPTENNVSESGGAPNLRVLLAVVALAAVVGAVLVCLYALSPQPRPTIAELLHTVSPYIVMAGPGLGALLYGKRASDQGKAHAEVLAKIDHQTNGVLEERMIRAAGQALINAGIVAEKAEGKHAAPIDSAIDVPAPRAAADDVAVVEFAPPVTAGG